MRVHSRALVPTMPAAYAVVGPLQASIEREDLRLAPQHASLWTIAPRGRYAAQVNGEWISRRQWHLPLRDGDLIVFVHVAHGGGNNSNPLRFILQIAVLVLSYYTGGAASAAYGAGWGAVASAAVAVVGNLLINALVPLPGAAGLAEVAAPSPTYTVAIQGNQARLGASIPVGYGHELVFPDFGAQPYSEFDDFDDQYYCAAFVRGLGHYEILGIYIDDTPLENFQGVTCVRVGPGQSTRSGPFTGVETFAEAVDVVDTRITTSVEIGGQDLVNAEWQGPWTANSAGSTVDRIYIDVMFPRGLGTVQDDGSITNRSVSYETAVRAIDNRGRAITEWYNMGTTAITAATTSLVRRSTSFTVTAARWQVRVRRTDAKSDNNRHLNDLQIVGLRSRLAVTTGIARTDVTGMVVRVRANEQLSGLAQRRIAVLARRLIPIYDTGTDTWGAPTATRNPAHAFADLLHDATYGRGVPDTRIDHDTLATLATLYETRQDRFDHSFDTRITVDDALRTIARAGRALPVFRRGAVYTMMRDGAQAGPVAAFMPRNMAADSFSVDYGLPTEETPDAVRITYRSNYSWADEVVIGQVHAGTIYAYDEGDAPAGVTDPVNVVEARLAGVTGRNHALREAAYAVADAYYRRTRMSWDTELEGLVPAYGSLVSIAHDISTWAQSGDVLRFDGVASLLYPADPVTWTPGEAHYVRIQARDGSVSAAIPCSLDPLFPDAIKLDALYTGTVVTDDEALERTRFLFGALSDVTRYVRITGIVPQGERSIRMAAVIEDERVHTVDIPWLPTTTDEIDEPSTGGTVDPNPGGDTRIVNLSSGRYVAGPVLPPSPWGFGIGIILRNDGALMLWLAEGGVQSESALAGQWIVPQPVTSTIAANYEVRFTLTASDGAATQIGVDPVDTWLSLSTQRELKIELPAGTAPGHSSSFYFDVAIRHVSTGTTLRTATIELALVVDNEQGQGN